MATSTETPSKAAGFNWPMDPDAYKRVIFGTTLASAAGGTIMASAGVLRRQPAFDVGVQGARSGLLTAFGFFSIREYFLIPALRLSNIQQEKPQTPQLSENVLASALAGGLGGGAWNTYLRGPRGGVNGAITAVIVCTSLQLISNKLHIARIRFVASRSASPDEPAAAPEPPKPGLLTRSKAWLGSLNPVRKIPDEEYLQTLSKRKDYVDGRLKEVRAELEEVEGLLAG